MHGVTRWADACGCTPNGEWKKGLRIFLETLAEEIDEVYENTTRKWLKDCWQARQDYIHVILGNEEFLQWQSEHISSGFKPGNSTALRQLMQAQVERQRMFTSCGWFFEDFDRIEPRNNLKYAAQAVALTETATGKRMMSGNGTQLKSIKSWKNETSAESLFPTLVAQFREMLTTAEKE
jgi:hypothetical protein